MNDIVSLSLEHSLRDKTNPYRRRESGHSRNAFGLLSRDPPPRCGGQDSNKEGGTAVTYVTGSANIFSQVRVPVFGQR